MPHYQASEYQTCAGRPLPAARLAQIWRGLPERDRLGFWLSLEETIADEVLILTAPAAQEQQEDRHAEQNPAG